MSDVTRILSQIEAGDPAAADQLLPLVYDELRKLAAARLAKEQPGQTLEATALVHEAYLRLVEPVGNALRRVPPAAREGEAPAAREGEAPAEPQTWHSRGHFFAAAAEAMRRILIERARSRLRQKHGGELNRIDVEHLDHLATRTPPEELLAINEALEKLAAEDAQAAQLVKLRFFAGLSLTEAAEVIAYRVQVLMSNGLMHGLGSSVPSRAIPIARRTKPHFVHLVPPWNATPEGPPSAGHLAPPSALLVLANFFPDDAAQNIALKVVLVERLR
jgi:DNA-directed RNA polymerase specialized sigma24 family protein